MVLVSDKSECRPKNKPLKPRAARKDEPLSLTLLGGAPLVMGTRRVNRSVASTANASPRPLCPPLSAFMMGQIGLFVLQANFIAEDKASPTIKAKSLDSSWPSCSDLEASVAVHDRQAINTPNPTANSRYAGSVTFQAKMPDKDSKWKNRRFRPTKLRNGFMERKRGEIVDNMKASYPDMPMCHSGKYQMRIPKLVSIDQNTYPWYTSAAVSNTADHDSLVAATLAADLLFFFSSAIVDGDGLRSLRERLDTILIYQCRPDDSAHSLG